MSETQTTPAAQTPIYAPPAAKVPAGHPSVRHKLGNPFAYFKKCLGLYIDGRGRAGIAEFWSFSLVSVLLLLPFLAVFLIDTTGSASGEPGALSSIALLVGVFIYLALIIPSITVTIRRLHDIGLSGWFYLLVFLFGGLFTLIIGLIPSKDRPNQHGPSPKNPETVGDVFA